MKKYDIGTIHETKQGCKLKIIKDISNTRKKIMFLDDFGYITETPTTSILAGSIKNPYHPTLLGKGYLGEGIYTSKDLHYKIWKEVLKKVYHENRKSLGNFKKVKLSKDWHNYQNFANDINLMYGFTLKDENGDFYCLNESILSKDKRVFSNKTCLFVPPRINKFLSQNKKKDGGLPTGVKYRHQDRRYEARMRVDGKSFYLGSCLTIEMAREFYVKARNERARHLAEAYRGKVDPRVTTFLENYNEDNYSK